MLMHIQHVERYSRKSTATGLYTCKQKDSGWCYHLSATKNTAMFATVFNGIGGESPSKPWSMRGGQQGIYGWTEVDQVMFANYQACGDDVRDVVFSNEQMVSMDSANPTRFKNIQLHNVDYPSLVYLKPGQLEATINIDADGNRHLFLIDEDASFLGRAGTVLPRAEEFSSETFYGVPYRDGINEPVRADGSLQPWWYINVPNVMRTDRDGFPVNVNQTYAASGYGIHGIHHPDCALILPWNAHRCFTSTSYRQVVLENMDRDRLIRRIAPMAISSAEGYTDILAGGGEFGWCFGYPCHFMTQTFFPVVATGTEYTVHFTGSNPQVRFVPL